MSKVITSFTPVNHGFQFTNYFQYHFPIKYPLPFAGNLDLDRIVFGLCGGMCFAALDFYLAGKTPPDYSQPDEIDKNLFTYLCDRQLDSLKITVLLKILDWMLAEDKDVAGRMLRYEIPKVRRSIDKGQPVVLCLIRVQGVLNVTQNHQVLATGYEISADGQVMTLTVYDPNHPGEQPTIAVRLDRDEFKIVQSTGEALRGFFVVPYKRQRILPKPPAPLLEAVSFGLEGGFRLQWPVDSQAINQYFGEHPENYAGFGLPGHEGLDLYAISGANIYACADGEVIEAGARPQGHAYGTQVRIKHEYNGEVYHTIYAHLKETHVQLGQQVKAGQRIGLADNTGNSFGDHLHLTLKKIGAKTGKYPDDIVDPLPYLQGTVPVWEKEEKLPSPSGINVYTNCQLNLRQRSSTESSILTTLPAGEELSLLGDATVVKGKIGQPDQWLQVQTASGAAGYVAAWLVTDVKQEAFPPSGLVVYPQYQVNLRSGPGTNFELLGAFTSDDSLNVLGNADTARAKIGKENQWLQVQAQSGARGFVAAWLVHLTGQVPSPAGLVVYPTVGINIRARPATDANIVTVAVPGDALSVLGDKAAVQPLIGQTNQWLQVQTPGKVTGYVAAWLVTAAKTTGSTTQTSGNTVIPTADVNLRAQPSVNSPRLGGAYRDDPLTILDADLSAARAKIGKQDLWIYVQNKEGVRGWVAAWFVKAG